MTIAPTIKAVPKARSQMLEATEDTEPWSFTTAIQILQSGRLPSSHLDPPRSLSTQSHEHQPGGLGDFSAVWKELGLVIDSDERPLHEPTPELGDSLGLDPVHATKGVKWRDEYDGADLEDNVEPEQISASNLRTRKRAARRARARERELRSSPDGEGLEDTPTDDESGRELEALRRSPDRRAVIADLLGRPRPEHVSPPTSPSPPNHNRVLRTPPSKNWPVANPSLWTPPDTLTSATKSRILPIDGLTPRLRKIKLIDQLSIKFPDEQKYLTNSGLLEAAFSPLNTSPIGVHVFIDMSNISIGFHDCLKVARGIPISDRVKRIPMDFHNFSLVLERGRPTAKRVLCGSDHTSATDQAQACGYETNILDRVHKAKTPTPKRRYRHTNPAGYNSASGVSHGETSGSETPGYASNTPATYKWSEQAVDEILHLKMSHSILDADKPSTIILATGDAAEAEYSDGFLRMVERALSRGWMVELVSFKLNTSSLYRRREFRAKWGTMFKWIQLDDFAESLIGEP